MHRVFQSAPALANIRLSSYNSQQEKFGLSASLGKITEVYFLFFTVTKCYCRTGWEITNKMFEKRI